MGNGGVWHRELLAGGNVARWGTGARDKGCWGLGVSVSSDGRQGTALGLEKDAEQKELGGAVVLFEGWVCALGATLVWALAPVCYRKSMEHLSVAGVNAVRCLGYVASAGIYLGLKEGWGALGVPLPPGALEAVVAGGIVWIVVGDALYLGALRNLGVTVSTSIASAFPLVAVPAAWIFLGEPVRGSALGAAACIALGLVFLTPQGDQERRLSLRGMTLLAGAMGCWLVGLLTTAEWAGQVSSASLEWWRSLGVAAVAWGWFWWGRSPKGELQQVSWGMRGLLVGAGAFSLTLGNVLFSEALSRLPADVVTNVVASRSFVAAFFGAMFLGERVTGRLLGGMGLVAAGVALTTW